MFTSNGVEMGWPLPPRRVVDGSQFASASQPVEDVLGGLTRFCGHSRLVVSSCSNHDVVVELFEVGGADPQSPWQRGTNENMNGLLRQYFPKGTDLTRWSAEDLQAVAATINQRPRKILAWKTPAEALDEHLQSLHNQNVATTT